MSVLLVISAVAGVAMAVAVLRMMPPADRRTLAVQAVVATVLALLVTVGGGSVVGVETPGFLVALSFGVAPVAVLLGAAAGEAAPRRRLVGRMLVLVWAGVVFPLCTIVPAFLLSQCEAPECRVADFGGALPLLVSSAAAVLLARRPHTVPVERSWQRFAVDAGMLWASGAVWLASLEGAWDAYLVRILFAVAAASLGAAVAWLLVDLLRQTRRHPVRSLADGLLAGLVAMVPGAATISFPWTLFVGATAGAVAALVYSARRLSRAGRARHWALVVLGSTAIGYFAPAMWGETIGFIFSGRIGALLPPLELFSAVAVAGVVVSAPIWALARRHP